MWQIFEPPTKAGVAMMRPLAALCLLCFASLGFSKVDKQARVDFSNQANLPVDVFWRNEADNSYSLLTSLEKGMRNGLNTFKGHKFLIAERGRPVGVEDFPNYIQLRAEQEMVIKGTEGNLVVLESDEGRKRAGLAPRRRNSNVTVEGVQSAPLEGTLLLYNGLEGNAVVYWRKQGESEYNKLVTLPPGTNRMVRTFRGHSLLVEDEDVDVHNVAENHEQVKEFEVKKIKENADGDVELKAESPPLIKSFTRESVRKMVTTCGRDAHCLSTLLFRSRLGELQKRVQQALDVRDKSEEAYRDYACVHLDSMAPAPAKVSTWVWDPENEGTSRGEGKCATEDCSDKRPSRRRELTIEQFFHSERDDASISLVHNMVSEAECDAIRRRSEPILGAAAVTGDAPGEKIISKSRKAKSAMVRPNHTDPGDVLGDLRERIFAFVNNRLNENFTLPGQEPFNAIKYNVSGDEYRLHCDGYCDSSPYIPGGRAATVVLYCDNAARGGQTSFTNADVVLKGKPGQAAFFHYVDRKTGYMDSGWTKHGGCPVLEGTKYISTQWIRHGVSDEDPWFTFTPTGDRDFTDPTEHSG